MAARLRQGDDWGIPGIVDRLKELSDRGDSYGLIANALSEEFKVCVSRNACIGKAHRMWGKRDTGPKVTKPRGSAARQSRQRTAAIAHHAVTKINAPKAQPETLLLRLADVIPLHLSLLDLQPGQCKYPYGDGPQYSFCGCPAIGSYCQPHAFLCSADMDAYRNRSEAQRARYARERAAA